MGPMLGTSGTWDVRDVGRQGRGTSGTWTWDVGTWDVRDVDVGRGTWDVDGLTRPAVYNGGEWGAYDKR